MELDLQSLFGLHVHSRTYWLRPHTPLPPSSPFGLIYEGAIGQPRLTTSLCDPLLSNHMDRQARTRDTMLVKSREMVAGGRRCTVKTTENQVYWPPLTFPYPESPLAWGGRSCSRWGRVGWGSWGWRWRRGETRSGDYDPRSSAADPCTTHIFFCTSL